MIPFNIPPFVGTELDYVRQAVEAQKICGDGGFTKKCNKWLEERFGAQKALLTTSGTTALEMATLLCGLKEGDEVILPSFTFSSTATSIVLTGATLVFVDVRPDTMNIDETKIEAAITDKTKAIIPVDLGGVPCDYDRIFDIVERKRALFRPNNDIQAALGRVAVMADTAHAFGAKYHGKMIGSVADFSSFSFHAVKNLTTAEGGALTWNTIPGIANEDIYKKLQLLSLHGQSKDALAKTKLGAWEYDIVGTYYKCNMTDIAAAMGLKQFERYPTMLTRRRNIIERYDAAFRPLGVETLDHYNDEWESSGHLYLVRIPDITVEQRNDIITKMAEAGIACNVHYKPLPMHTAYKNLGFDIADYPNAYARFVNEITLPLHTCLTDEQVAYIIEQFAAILQSL